MSRTASLLAVALCWLTACQESGTEVQLLPPFPPEIQFRDVAAGDMHTCAIGADAITYCWGRGATGALGLDTLLTTAVPLPVAARIPFGALSAGEDHTCAVTTAGELHCWGQNTQGKLGTGNTRPAASPVLIPLLGDTLFRTVEAGGGHTCALTISGELYCWGRGSLGELGYGNLNDRLRPTAPLQRDTIPFAAVATGRHHTCAADRIGATRCWGWNHAGQLGVGSNVTLGLPERLRDVPPFVALTAGREHTCALTQDGIAYCWGRGDFGQLGVGTLANRNVPTQVTGNLRFTMLSAGAEHTCGITTDGTAYCWGEGSRGRLGNGDASGAPRAEPTRVSTDLRFRRISAGGQHTCAVSDSATLHCWGFGAFGQLGNGLSTDHFTPAPVRAPRPQPIAP